MTKKDTALSRDLITLSMDKGWESMFADETFAYFPEKDEWRKKLCYTLLKWAGQPTSLSLDQFLIEAKIWKMTMRRWVDKYEDIAQAYKFAKTIIGDRRIRGALLKKYDVTMVLRETGAFDDEQAQINKDNAELKNKAEGNKATIIHVHDSAMSTNQDEIKLSQSEK